jgi:hypothetical protein
VTSTPFSRTASGRRGLVQAWKCAGDRDSYGVLECDNNFRNFATFGAITAWQ